MENTRNCSKCEGKGQKLVKGFTYGNKVYPDKIENCRDCVGLGYQLEPDYSAIALTLKGRKGLRSVKPSGTTKEDYRSAYVWRLVRFHGGKDVTLPVMAEIMLGKDEYKKELDQLVDKLAKLYFGTDLAGASRWGRALGYI